MPDSLLGSKVRELFEIDAENKRRLREIEQRLASTDNSAKRADSSLIEIKGKLLELSGALKSDRVASENKIKELENIISEILNNMKRLVEKSEVAGLRELVEIYNPIKAQFITREEVEEMLSKVKKR